MYCAMQVTTYDKRMLTVRVCKTNTIFKKKYNKQRIHFGFYQRILKVADNKIVRV